MELCKRRNNGFFVSAGGSVFQVRLIGFGNRGRHFGKGLKQRTLHWIVEDLCHHLAGHFAERYSRRGHFRGQALFHKGDGLVHKRRYALKPQNDVFIIFARLRRHHGERAGNILLNTFHLIHRHHQIVRNHTFDRNSVVVEFQAFDRRVEKILI